MSRRSRVILGVLAVGGAALLAAAQDRPGTDRPGQPTQARVWIENRGRGEAVPVVVQEPVTFADTATVHVRLTAQEWEYRTLTFSANGNGVNASDLAAAGAAGWEAVGVLGQTPATTILLKRPR